LRWAQFHAHKFGNGRPNWPDGKLIAYPVPAFLAGSHRAQRLQPSPTFYVRITGIRTLVLTLFFVRTRGMHTGKVPSNGYRCR
jgi:hypothetical protein